MFERRLKIFLLLLLVGSLALVLRAAQIQILDREYWRDAATRMTRQSKLIQSTRGSILDRNGKMLAYDAPCVDACVDYHAITEEPDPDWITKCAIANLVRRFGKKIQQPGDRDWLRLRDQECARLRGDIAAMWLELGRIDEKDPDDIAEIRRNIVARIEMREKYLFWRNYEQASRSDHDSAPGWYRHFLGDSSSPADDTDTFEKRVGEETDPQVILHAIPMEIQARLARQQERFFFLSLVPGKCREYPYGRVACHVLGYLGPVGPQETGANDPYGTDELRKYWKNDLIGRTGVEALCEGVLRGTCGQIEKISGSDEPVARVDPLPGKNVRLSIDIDLQSDLENDLVKARVHKDSSGNVEKRFNQHGAIVVLDIATNQVLALASNPGYDPNMLDSQFSTWAVDDLNRPLQDRATELAVEPGSTVKPIVGCGAIAHHFMTPTSTIQCRGELIIDGKAQPHNRCWTYAIYERGKITAPSHELASRGDPSLLPNDMLTISDGLKHSCNVVFETIANMMGMKELSYWYDQFGLGRPTGIGIEESPGRLYRPADDRRADVRALTWSAGIGEGVVHATPLQMANVAATIARGGIWMRPELVAPEDMARATTRPTPLPPERVDLHLPPDSIAAVQKGMHEVCTHYGSGAFILPDEMDRGPDDPPLDQDPLRGIPLAGKTGSAQTGQLMTVPVRGADGQILHDAGGKPLYRKVQFGEAGTEGWYLATKDPDPEKHMAQAWMIVYAPADHPQVAICVLVENGEAGGAVAGPIAHDVLVDCIRHKYLSPSK